MDAKKGDDKQHDLLTWIRECDDEELVGCVYDLVYDSMGFISHSTKVNPHLRQQPNWLAAVYRLWTMESEVTNGGFLQFFDNCGLAFARDAVADCQMVGVPERGQVLELAIQTFEAGVGDPDDQRWLRINCQFYDLQDSVDMAQKLASFIKCNVQRLDEI